MSDERPPVDVYCYYKIDGAKIDPYAAVARQLQEKYLFRPECLLYQFRRGVDEARRDTMMECGTFRDLDAYRFVQRDMEQRFADLYRDLDALIVGGLAARKFEFFEAL